MAKKGKRYQEALKLVDRTKLYEPREAFELLPQVAKAKFDETIELAVRLGVDPRHADQQVRGTVVLPHGTGRTERILVIAKADKVKEAEEAGADYAGGAELVEKIQNENWFEFDVVIATPDMMGEVGKIGRILGPKGLMPNPKAGTVTFDVAEAVEEVKAGKVEYRVDKAAIINVPIGKASFGTEKLYENFKTIIETIVRARPAAAKGRYLRSVTVTSTMGPGIRINGQRVTDAILENK